PILLPSGCWLRPALPRIRRPAGCHRPGAVIDDFIARNDGHDPSEAPMESPSAPLHVHQTEIKPPLTRVSLPVVERIARWSARHAAVALFGWLLLVAGAVIIGNMLGTKNINSYDPGEAGRAERVLARPGVIQRPTETVLIQARSAGRTVANDPDVLRAAGQVAAALKGQPNVANDVRSPTAPAGHGRISRERRCTLGA